MAASRRAKNARTPDHRPRVARERRARTRQRIVEVAIAVFAAKGPEGVVIDDFIRAAGIARGTFYNHFRTTDTLLIAASRWLEDQLMLAIESSMATLESPVDRLATGVRLWLRRSREDATLRGFVVRNPSRGQLVERILGADLRAARRAGHFRIASAALGRDLVVGTVREVMTRMMRETVPAGYPDEVARAILRGLRLDERSIARVMALPLPRLGAPPSAGSSAPRGRRRAVS